VNPMLSFERKAWARDFATQRARIHQPGPASKNEFGFAETNVEGTALVKCRVIGPISTPREVIEGDRTIGLADFEVRIPWDTDLVVMIDATVELLDEVGGVHQAYRVLGTDRGRPDALYIGLSCVRAEVRA
jgi:hypothetical protein